MRAFPYLNCFNCRSVFLHQENLMKKSLLLTSFLFFLASFAVSIQAKQWMATTSSSSQKVTAKLVSQTGNESVIKFHVPGFYINNVQTPLGQIQVLSAEKASRLLETGSPDVLKMAASIIIPDQSTMEVQVVSVSYHDYTNILLAPSKGNLKRDQDPSSIPYVYGPAYSNNGFFPGKLAELRDPYILRDFRGQTVVVYPFQYNPVTQTLRVYDEITVKIVPVISQTTVNAFTRSRQPQPNPIYTPIYTSRFLNFNQTQYTPAQEIGRMLIISDASLISTMQPFVDWKNKMGQATEIVDVASIGANSTAIKTFIENKYNTDGLTFVLLVGDGPQIPAYPSMNGDSDPSYGDILGNDSYAEVIVGRFSANTPQELETQVQRSINYEKYPDPSGQWYHKGICVGSDQGPGDDGEMDFEHERNIRQKYLGYTYTQVDEIFDGSQGGVDLTGDPGPQDLADAFNDGRSILTYTGHGSQNSCGTTSFSSADVQSLTNENMLPFFWSVACVNGDFQTGDCLAEALMRTTSVSGAPIGAIATLMSTINQSWDPPMDGQDEMVDILVETYPGNIKHTFGGISVNGCMHMNDEYGAAGVEMTDTWTCFGDPSIMVRTATPELIPVAHDATIDENISTWTVQCNIDQALVCLSYHNQIIATGYALSGTAYLTIPGLTVGDTLDVTVTAYNHIPYFGTVVVVPNGTTQVGTTDANAFSLSAGLATQGKPSTISFTIPSNTTVSIDLYSSSGQLISKVLENQKMNSGTHRISQDVSGLSSGIYFVKMKADQHELVTRMVVE